MTFTDDDLKRLKKLFTLDEYVHRDEIFDLTRRLLTRLEAAELYCQRQRATSPENQLIREAWNRASGR